VARFSVKSVNLLQHQLFCRFFAVPVFNM